MLIHFTYIEGVPNDDELVLVSLAFLAPLSSLLVFFFASLGTKDSENLLSLFLKRRKLEEKNKIAALQARNEN